MNDLIEKLIQYGGLITPQIHENKPKDTDYYTDDDLYELEYNKFMDTDPTYEQKLLYNEQEQANRNRDLAQLLQHEPIDIDNFIGEYKMPTQNPYSNGMNFDIPDEYAQDYMNEYSRAEQDPLLMYILQKNAQNGFASGPIGTDSYYEEFDPDINPSLVQDYQQFLDTYYPGTKYTPRPNSMDEDEYRELLNSFRGE